MDKQAYKRLARAFAPETVQSQLDELDKMERVKRSLQADIAGTERAIMETVLNTEIHDAVPGTVPTAMDRALSVTIH